MIVRAREHLHRQVMYYPSFRRPRAVGTKKGPSAAGTWLWTMAGLSCAKGKEGEFCSIWGLRKGRSQGRPQIKMRNVALLLFYLFSKCVWKAH